MSLRRLILVAAMTLPLAFTMSAQKYGVKTNLLFDAALTPNIGVEMSVAKHWTIELDYQINAWNIKDHKLKHYVFTPEARWWYCEKFQGSFFAVHLLAGQYNVGNIHNNINFLGTHYSYLTKNRYEGWFVGAGLGYGYAWSLSKHWNIEAEIGLGCTFTRFDQYPACVSCGDKLVNNGKHYTFGLTRLGVNLEYLF